VDITKVAERTISDDLEYLISKTVDTGKADYAVVTGVQIHNWGTSFEDDSPNMEFVAPTSGEWVCLRQMRHSSSTCLLHPGMVWLPGSSRQALLCWKLMVLASAKVAKRACPAFA
jgi:hypothetical protein